MREVINEVSIEVSTETPKTMLKIPRILIAAPSSGSGKTLFTCALLRLLQRKGIRAAAFKCGPDYIDPMFHRDVLGTPSHNLDLYLAGEEGVRRSLAAGFREANAEIAVIEGVMGYLDGTGESGLTGSSYHLAVSTHTPVILTVNARGMSRSAAALVKGFAEYGTDRQIKGLFLNRVSQPSAGMIANWIREDTDLPVLASLPQEKAITFTSRHLGLIEPGEIPDLQNRIERAADLLEETMDLDQLLAIARSAPDVSAPVDTGHTKAVPSDRTGAKAGGTELQTQDPHSPVTIAVAMDEAFSFYYEDNLELLASYGAQILRFSPIHDSRIPDADGLLLGGGYPELWAEKLSSNKSMRTSIRSAAEAGMPILAECGGFQYLQQELETKDGAVYEMAGVLDGRSAMTGKLVQQARFMALQQGAKPSIWIPDRRSAAMNSTTVTALATGMRSLRSSQTDVTGTAWWRRGVFWPVIRTYIIPPARLWQSDLSAPAGITDRSAAGRRPKAVQAAYEQEIAKMLAQRDSHF